MLLMPRYLVAPPMLVRKCFQRERIPWPICASGQTETSYGDDPKWFPQLRPKQRIQLEAYMSAFPRWEMENPPILICHLPLSTNSWLRLQSSLTPHRRPRDTTLDEDHKSVPSHLNPCRLIHDSANQHTTGNHHS